ncbi:sensor histidine kinase [Nocardioides jishulii]|uniref:histidine kinase n=1 Tax=Nocardioides jishulii TaxID=2575440 RepID=A0A4U2YQQ5_9ACTN|nr:HAMP domain-containing sensor histidine kinase [Nocardioides jishulii]QCX26465.1 HAMP domain-containing histidine kinase [Nocardioides jishulii]TKI63729.1 HAMP domain-containing histidine kinase [Nocardioides jishulii]
MSGPSQVPRRHADRPTSMVWPVSTLVVSVLVTASILVVDGPDAEGWPTALGLVVLTAVASVKWLVHTGRLSQRWRPLLPVLSLAALLWMGTEIVPVAPTAALVVTLPLLWLAFEFGTTGALLAFVGLLAVLQMLYSGGVVPGQGEPLWVQYVPLVLLGLGLLFGGLQLALERERREQRLTEQADRLRATLEASEDQLLLMKTLLDTVQVTIVAYDDAGEQIWDNPDARALAARAGIRSDGTAEPVVHYYEADRVTPVPPEEYAIPRAHRGEEFDAQLAWFGPPGDQVAYLLYARQIHRTPEDRYGYVIVGIPVTDVLDSVRAREEFLTTVSHELRTPLTSIIGYHELIEEELDADDVTALSMLRIAQRNAHVLLSRVSQLIQASGTGEGMELKLRSVDVVELTDTTLTQLHHAADAAGIDLTVQVQPGLKATLDPDRFAQVIDNLVNNAVKYTPAPGAVDVRLWQHADDLVLEVADTGPGLSESEQSHVFERFYRTASATEQAVQGIGVGLSVVKAIVEAHGGVIELESNPGAGTRFEVRLPLDGPPQAEV